MMEKSLLLCLQSAWDLDTPRFYRCRVVSCVFTSSRGPARPLCPMLCLSGEQVYPCLLLSRSTDLKGKMGRREKKKTPQSLSHTTWMHWPLMKLPVLDMNSFPYRIFKSGWRYQMWQQLPKIKYQTGKHVTAQESSIFHAVVSGRTLPSFFFLFFFFSMGMSPYNPVFQIPLRLLSNCKCSFILRDLLF